MPVELTDRGFLGGRFIESDAAAPAVSLPGHALNPLPIGLMRHDQRPLCGPLVMSSSSIMT
jgi:hypothetical protein